MQAHPASDGDLRPSSNPAEPWRWRGLRWRLVAWALLLAILVAAASTGRTPPAPAPTAASPASTERTFSMLVDDFQPQPAPGTPVYRFNRLGGDRGALNTSSLVLSTGLITTTVAPRRDWGGAWLSLNHLAAEGVSLNFAALQPAPIRPAYQSRVTGLTARVTSGTPGRRLRFELKDGDQVRWQDAITLAGGPQEASFALPPLGEITQLTWVLDQASPGDRVTLGRVALTAVTPVTDTATVAFVWSYGMLLNNWSPATGLVRDKATDASGAFDAIQATGSLAAATALAVQLGVVARADATRIVGQIERALLVNTPRFHGLLPHFVTAAPTGAISIAPETEWSSVDTVIAAVGLLTAQHALGLDPSRTEELLRRIDWADLTGADGMVAHGYHFSGERIASTWDVFGGESWLVGLAHAGATDRVAPISSAAPPTANGSGFIDELAWLFVPPPSEHDAWGSSWATYRGEAADRQLAYYPARSPDSCLARLGLFGLSAAEVPAPPLTGGTYQAFGVGGQFAEPNDGAATLGAPAVTPHEVGLIASLRPDAALAMWDWLIASGAFSPLTNVESLLFPADASCDPDGMVWNGLKGSWNLALQTLGWGRYLAERAGQTPALWRATAASPLLRRGYALLAPSEPVAARSTTWLPYVAAPPSVGLSLWREGEHPDASTVGERIARPGASGGAVHGRFGAATAAPWPAQPGLVRYDDLSTPRLPQLYLRLRYAKHSVPLVPIRITLDGEPAPRATRYLIDQGSWEQFAWSEPIPLGSVEAGTHTITFATDGQQYGVADLDALVLTDSPAAAVPSISFATYLPGPAEQAVHPVWDRSAITCASEQAYRRSPPGTYLYQVIEGGTNRLQLTTDPGLVTAMRDSSLPPQGEFTTTVVGYERQTTPLGTVRAVRIDTTKAYRLMFGIHSYEGTYERRAWYACGYGLIYAMASHSGTKDRLLFRSSATLELRSFTPPSTNEAHVRYILADMQLGHHAEAYRANVADEETSEALRRWDAGLRVVNSERFARTILAGEWQIVYAGTTTPIKGMDATLGSSANP